MLHRSAVVLGNIAEDMLVSKIIWRAMVKIHEGELQYSEEGGTLKEGYD